MSVNFVNPLYQSVDISADPTKEVWTVQEDSDEDAEYEEFEQFMFNTYQNDNDDEGIESLFDKNVNPTNNKSSLSSKLQNQLVNNINTNSISSLIKTPPMSPSQANVSNTNATLAVMTAARSRAYSWDVKLEDGTNYVVMNPFTGDSEEPDEINLSKPIANFIPAVPKSSIPKAVIKQQEQTQRVRAVAAKPAPRSTVPARNPYANNPSNYTGSKRMAAQKALSRTTGLLKSKREASRLMYDSPTASSSSSKAIIPQISSLYMAVLGYVKDDNSPKYTQQVLDSYRGMIIDGKVGIYTLKERAAIIEKFRTKKRNRIWKKTIKYDCRKRLAEVRPRVKGRFVSRKETSPPENEELPIGTGAPTKNTIGLSALDANTGLDLSVELVHQKIHHQDISHLTQMGDDDDAITESISGVGIDMNEVIHM